MSIDKYLDRTINERYRIDTKLVGDHTGPLYKAYDEVIDRRVVIKFVRLDVWTSIRSNVQKASSFDYPYLVDIFDFGSSGGSNFVVLRFIQGDTLRTLLKRGEFDQGNPLAPRVLLSVAAVLDFLANEGFTRIVPLPEQIIVEPDGKTYLADYNLTWIINQQHHRLTLLNQPGPPSQHTPYLSPEIRTGAPNITPASDQYALAIVAAEVLGGQALGGTLEGLRQGLINRPLTARDLPTLSPIAAQAIERATQPAPDRRFATSREFVLAALREVNLDARVTGEFNIGEVPALDALESEPAPHAESDDDDDDIRFEDVVPATKKAKDTKRRTRNHDLPPAPPAQQPQPEAESERPPTPQETPAAKEEDIALGDVDEEEEVAESGIGLGEPGTIGYGAPPAPQAPPEPQPAPSPPLPRGRFGRTPPAGAVPKPAPPPPSTATPTPDLPRSQSTPPRAPASTSDDDVTPVLFDAYYPRAARVNAPIKFIVYALHEANQPAVQADVAGFAAQLGGSVPVPISAAAKPQLRVGTLVTVVLISDEYDETPYLTKRWNGKWVRYEFELRPPQSRTGGSFNIDVSIQVRGIEIARIRDCNIFLGVGEDDPTEPRNPLAAAKFSERRTQPYHHIFVSYSRRDTPVVEAYRVAQIALGNQVFMDTYSIRSGEDWQAALARAIDEADIFQLFWSENSARSENVRHEWEYALDFRCKADGCRTFIRPVYWETPLPDVPDKLGHLNFVYAKLTAQRPLLPWLMLGGVALLVLLVVVVGVLA